MADGPKDKEYTKRVPTNTDFPWKDEPTQKIEQWPDGTIHRRITTDGHETHQIWHSSGAYEEYRADGSRVSFTSNNHIHYSKGGTTLTLDNNGDIRLKGHNRINVDVDAHITFGKNASMVVGGMLDVAAMGHIKMAGTDIGIQTIKGSLILNSDHDIEMNAEKGRIHGNSKGVTSFNSKADFHIYAEEDIDMTAENNSSLVAVSGSITETSEKENTTTSKSDKIQETSKGNNTRKSDGDINEEASGNINEHGSTINMNG